MQVANVGPSSATNPAGMWLAGGDSRVAWLSSSTQLICPSRAAPGGPAAPTLTASGAMRRRTITIAAPQHRHRSLGRSLKGGCVDAGGRPGVPGAMQADAALGLSPMRNSASRWRCLQLGCAKPKLRERRNPLGKTCCNTSHKKCAPLTVRVVFLPGPLSR